MCPWTHSGVYTNVKVLQTLFPLSLKVPRNATALKRWALMDSRWKRKEDSLGSTVDRVRSRARSEIKSMPVLLMGPNVSRASIIIIKFGITNPTVSCNLTAYLHVTLNYQMNITTIMMMMITTMIIS